MTQTPSLYENDRAAWIRAHGAANPHWLARASALENGIPLPNVAVAHVKEFILRGGRAGAVGMMFTSVMVLIAALFVGPGPLAGWGILVASERLAPRFLPRILPLRQRWFWLAAGATAILGAVLVGTTGIAHDWNVLPFAVVAGILLGAAIAIAIWAVVVLIVTGFAVRFLAGWGVAGKILSSSSVGIAVAAMIGIGVVPQVLAALALTPGLLSLYIYANVLVAVCHAAHLVKLWGWPGAGLTAPAAMPAPLAVAPPAPQAYAAPTVVYPAAPPAPPTPTPVSTTTAPSAARGDLADEV